MTNPKPYWNPYAAGTLLGLVLLGAFLIAGQGLGASAFPKRTITYAAHEVAPAWTEANPELSAYIADGANPLKNWLVVEVVAVLLGGFVGAVLAGRFKPTVERGPNVSVRTRLLLAFAGGTIMGFAAALGRGCTSGQALSGGATLATGSWIFMMAVFAGGYAFAYLVRRQWI